MKNLKNMTFIDGEFSMDINISVEEKTVWMTANDMAVMFKRDRTAICRQIQNIRKNNALFVEHSCAKFALEGVNKLGIHSRPAMFYNLEIILLVAAKMNSNRGIKLKEYVNDYLSKIDSVFDPLDEDNNNRVIIYDNGHINLAVNVSPKEDTVWLTQSQIAQLFETTRANITIHINNILESGELSLNSICKDFLHMGDNQRGYKTSLFNLDMILAVGYRVQSKRAIEFRKWATQVLKQYLLKGYVLDSNRILITKENFIQLETDVQNIKKEIKDIKEKTFIEPPKDKLFVDGQYYDAYEFLCDLVKQSQKNIVIIDPYFDLKGLDILSKALKDINRTIVISDKAPLKNSELDAFNKQYGDVIVKSTNKFHDRFLIIDNSICYSLGTSFNHMGKKLFSIHRIEDMDIINLLIEKIRNE